MRPDRSPSALLTLLTSVDARPGGGGGGGPVELAVNHLGVPMFVQKGCAE